MADLDQRRMLLALTEERIAHREDALGDLPQESGLLFSLFGIGVDVEAKRARLEHELDKLRTEAADLRAELGPEAGAPQPAPEPEPTVDVAAPASSEPRQSLDGPLEEATQKLAQAQMLLQQLEPGEVENAQTVAGLMMDAATRYREANGGQAHPSIMDLLRFETWAQRGAEKDGGGHVGRALAAVEALQVSVLDLAAGETSD